MYCVKVLKLLLTIVALTKAHISLSKVLNGILLVHILVFLKCAHYGSDFGTRMLQEGAGSHILTLLSTIMSYKTSSNARTIKSITFFKNYHICRR